MFFETIFIPFYLGIGEYYKRIILSFNGVCKFSVNVFRHKQRSLYLWTILYGLCELEKIGRLLMSCTCSKENSTLK